ncbi:MAG: hypothetical protein NZ772_13700, partial [Cyanobacteria bacterium]|nr:hypothetical protein [Cyanobacteriota bacterium]MDW8202446.1 hypothetical protein [Cyanobacteriota bacterium SKYGB_h_bin112]
MTQSSRRSQTVRLRVFTSGSPAPLLQGLDVWYTLGLIEAVDITGVTIANPSTGPLQRAIRLEISTTQPTPNLWQGLHTWADLGLLTDIKLVVDLTTSATHEHLLQGLDTLLTLGLLSTSQVQDLCQSHLTCVLPLPRMASAASSPTPAQLGDLQKAASTPTRSTPVAATPTHQPAKLPSAKLLSAKPPRSPNPFAMALSSLMAELSVRWLLFLGVFLVISSSGVLAASQWQRFPIAGQYLTLLAYTLVFWAASLWASGQSGLTLTAQTLRLVTLLLVPINVWAMDTLHLWRSVPLLGIGVVATIVLGGVTWHLFQFQPAPRRLPLVNFLLLSGLHWGWKITGWPGLAIYGGTIATALLTAYQTRSRSQATEPQARMHLPAVRATVMIASLLILLGRAITLAEVPITSLGLALGICGFLMAWLDWQYRPERLRLLGADWEVIGLGGLGLGWLLAVVDGRHGQVLAILVLAGWGFWQRLLRSWQRRDLLALAGIGLNGLTAGWLLIPNSIQDAIVNTCARWAGLSGNPAPLLSVGLLPYLAVMLAVTGWLHRQDKLRLARFGDWLTLGLGSILTLASTASPALQTLNLAGSTVLLLW